MLQTVDPTLSNNNPIFKQIWEDVKNRAKVSAGIITEKDGKIAAKMPGLGGNFAFSDEILSAAEALKH